MPIDEDIKTGYMGSWASQWPQQSNTLIADANISIDDKIESGEYTPDEGSKWKDFYQDFYTKDRPDIFNTIDRSGNFIDRQPSGLANLWSRLTGQGSTIPKGTYHPPMGVNQTGMYFDYPEAKETIYTDNFGRRNLYGDPVTRKTTYNAFNDIISPGSDIIEYLAMDYTDKLPDWVKASTAGDTLREGIAGLFDDQGFTIDEDNFMLNLNKLKNDAKIQLMNEYIQTGEFDYPDPGMVYGTDDYMLENPMIPGYELGQGLDMDPNLEPIQALGYKQISNLSQTWQDILTRTGSEELANEWLASQQVAGGDSYDQMRYELYRIGIDPTGMGNDEVKQIYDINIGGTTGEEDQFGIV